MAFGNYQSGPQQKASSSSSAKSTDVSTSGVRLTNWDVRKYLNINYWKRAMSIDIGPIPQSANRADSQPWNWNESKPTIHIAMTYSSLTVLEEVCDEVYESIKKTGSFSNVGAPCGATLNHLVEINNGSTLGKEPGIYLAIYKDRDESGRPQSFEIYPFSTRVIERNYDKSTGQSVKDISRTQDFKDFRRCVHEAVSALTMATAHTVQEIQNLDKLSILNSISAICAQNGITPETSSKPAPAPAPARQYNNGGGYSKGNYGGNRNYGNNGYKRPYGGNNNYGNRYGNNNQSGNDTPPWKQDNHQQSNEITLSSPDQANFDNIY